MNKSLFLEALQAYRSYCNGTGEPFIERSIELSSVNGDICTLRSKRGYPVRYSISGKAILG